MVSQNFKQGYNKFDCNGKAQKFCCGNNKLYFGVKFGVKADKISFCQQQTIISLKIVLLLNYKSFC